MSTRIEKLRLLCRKIIPLVYDESLSYYEVVCKVAQKVNEVIELAGELTDNIEAFETTITSNLNAFETETRQHFNNFTATVTNKLNEYEEELPGIVRAEVLKYIEVQGLDEDVKRIADEYLAQEYNYTNVGKLAGKHVILLGDNWTADDTGSHFNNRVKEICQMKGFYNLSGFYYPDTEYLGGINNDTYAHMLYDDELMESYDIDRNSITTIIICPNALYDTSHSTLTSRLNNLKSVINTRFPNANIYIITGFTHPTRTTGGDDSKFMQCYAIRTALINWANENNIVYFDDYYFYMANKPYNWDAESFSLYGVDKLMLAGKRIMINIFTAYFNNIKYRQTPAYYSAVSSELSSCIKKASSGDTTLTLNQFTSSIIGNRMYISLNVTFAKGTNSNSDTYIIKFPHFLDFLMFDDLYDNGMLLYSHPVRSTNGTLAYFRPVDRSLPEIESGYKTLGLYCSTTLNYGDTFTITHEIPLY